ncbi:hypothetical protein PI23P_07515 [Polaribacter irgensii 23-P]|uniref:Uncharacterized protein n=1 Tax=Polaribacter irgensii 23-P TaxID=313594 RepID=A4BZ62_9FLAO|nr:hypothetical protein PI23P_07515 [Polaribacter irgensii 23-P]
MLFFKIFLDLKKPVNQFAKISLRSLFFLPLNVLLFRGEMLHIPGV